MSRSVTCTLCRNDLNIKFNVTEYIQHVRLFHAYKPDFKITCGINGCLRSYRNIGTFKNHVSATHNSNGDSVDSVIRDHSSFTSCDEDTGSSVEDSDNFDFDLVDEMDNISNAADATEEVTMDIGVEANNVGSLDCSQELLQKSSAFFC